VLIDPQYAPRVIAKPTCNGMVSLIAATAKAEDVDLFRRFDVMKRWHKVDNIAFETFVSPDGHAVRFIISHEGDPATAHGISLIPQIKNAAFEAIKGTPLEGSKIYLAGTASTYKDMQHGSNFDLLIAGIALYELWLQREVHP
jgi:hypothetical protein